MGGGHSVPTSGVKEGMSFSEEGLDSGVLLPFSL